MLTDPAAYWNRVANEKTFTHPYNIPLLKQFISKQAAIIDYGCGYGRGIKILSEAGFENVTGYDTSIGLIERGNREGVQNIAYIKDLDHLLCMPHSVDCIVLFAVLTCIPDNKSQVALMEKSYSILKPEGILYISDYYLQQNQNEVGTYSFLENDEHNFGVFTLPDGSIFRHHTCEWIASLLSKFEVAHETTAQVFTMNGSPAEAFQIIATPIHKGLTLKDRTI
ncbi:MAG: class I SAM-dependent methyltransferase [Bacteroidota bacterium]